MRSDAAAVTDRLERSIQRITWAMLDCEPADLNVAPDVSEWSPIQILAHLRASNDLYVSRVMLILTSDAPTLTLLDVDRWMELAGYTIAPLDQTLMVFQRQRQELIWQLRHLPDIGWDRIGRHPEQGDLTLLAMLTAQARHEEEHVEQLRELLDIDDEDDA